MGYKMFLGLCTLLTVLMVDQADSFCCHAKLHCTGWCWGRRCTGRCLDGTQGSPFCGIGHCNCFGCNCYGGCRHSKRDVVEDARSLLDMLRREEEDIAPEGSVMAGRGFEHHDKDEDHKLSKQEALGMLEAMAEVDVSKLPDDWFESMDTNNNGFIDPDEYDKDLAKTLK
ncbi:uncharacterized protein LOC118418619 [Branchiostoma floridae]|uniref:Uncharacterized protein LOC118418619 n=1 Tax=Branchiostoma floridae TaxID=7739 RepID=C3ZC07_BRAFL|nr:uncharacterized protein LOC118418619 [Branchiostoma floridae]|eukprot:XP_002593937.1 hypothetical protein BRAFLDRAFT_128535 [Branchiostoma floridae]